MGGRYEQNIDFMRQMEAKDFEGLTKFAMGSKRKEKYAKFECEQLMEYRKEHGLISVSDQSQNEQI